MLVEVRSALAPYVPIKPKTIWPALIFAASRKDRVIGRTKILRVSTMTKKGFNQSGAPPGRIPAAKLEGELYKEDKIRLNQIGIAKDMVKNKCLVVLKTYGKRPVKLIERVKINSALSSGVSPFKCVPVVRFVWELIISLGYIINWVNDVGVAQKLEVNVNKNNKFIPQKVGEGKLLNIVVVAGSKAEKISVSIKT